MGRPTRPVQGWWPCPTPIPAVPNTCIDKLPQSAMITSFSTCACAGAQIHTQHGIGGLACDTRRTGPHHEDQMSMCAHVRPCALAQGVQSPLAGQIVFRSVLFGAFGAAKRWLSTNADGTVRPLTTADFYKVSLLSSPLKLPCTRTCPVVCVFQQASACSVFPSLVEESGDMCGIQTASLGLHGSLALQKGHLLTGSGDV